MSFNICRNENFNFLGYELDIDVAKAVEIVNVYILIILNVVKDAVKKKKKKVNFKYNYCTLMFNDVFLFLENIIRYFQLYFFISIIFLIYIFLCIFFLYMFID